MKEQPILFNAQMVRAILSGQKTQTRRIMKPQMTYGDVGGIFASWQMPSNKGGSILWPNGKDQILSMCPHGQPGDVLWVRETWAAPHAFDGHKPLQILVNARIHFAADENLGGLVKRPSLFMPRWASRITLEITNVRVERLQEISEADAVAEGCKLETMTIIGDDGGSAIYGPNGYRDLWESINGNRPKLPSNTASKRYARVKAWLEKHPDHSWDANPWVWVIEFKRIEK